MKRALVGMACLWFGLATVCVGQNPQVWFNEVNYDPPGTDSNEYIEIAGPAGLDVTGYKIYYYNGANSNVYGTNVLVGTLDDEGCGYGAMSVLFTGIQNGAPDGLALVDSADTLMQFLSYEGTMTGVGGPANGVASVNIGTQNNTNLTLQLAGTATNYSGFTWATNTPSQGTLNAGQAITGCTPVPPTNVYFFASSAIVDENVGTYPVTIYKNRSGGDVNGSVFLLGTATEGTGADYTLDTTNFTMNGATTSAVITITINDEVEVEGAETIILSLYGVTGATTTSPDVFTLTVNPSDQPTYAITITTPTNGTVTTTPASNTTAGTTVAINATPDTGYAVDTISVVSADSNAVTVAGTTFTMPAQAVTVTVSFKVFVGSTVFISEIADPSDNATNGRFVELFNAGTGSVDLAAGQWHLARQANAGAVANIALTGTIAAAGTYVVAGSSNYPTVYPSAPAANQTSGSVDGNGNDGYFLYSGGRHTNGVLEDAYGVLGQDGTNPTVQAWAYADKRAVRQTAVTNGNPTWTASEWTIASAAVADMTPGVHPDGPPPVTTNVHFTASAAGVAESVGTYVVTVIKSRAEGDVGGTVALSGTATEGAGADYTVDTTNFTLNGTTTSAVFTVTINDDADEEAAETIVLTLTNVTGGTLSAPAAFTLTINANDAVIVPEGLAAFRFQTDPYLAVSTKDADLTVTDLALSAGTIETAIVFGDYFPNEPYVEETAGWTNSAQAGTKAFVFTVTPASGKTLTIDGIFFRAYATAAGPSAYGFDIGGGLATYAVDAPDSTLLVVSQAVAGVTGQTGPVEIRIQGWLNGSRTSTGSGVFRLDDLVIYGSLSGGTPAAPEIEPITFVAGTGFRFPVPTNYTLNAVYGADAALTAGGDWTWSTLSAPGDYSESGGIVTITTSNAMRRMIRIGVLAAP